MAPGPKFSILPTFISKLMPGKKFDMTTDSNGSPRAMVPIGMYESIMPLDIMPTFLLRALMVGDVEQAEKLGALSWTKRTCPCAPSFARAKPTTASFSALTWIAFGPKVSPATQLNVHRLGIMQCAKF